jgi:hypothetical protein
MIFSGINFPIGKREQVLENCKLGNHHGWALQTFSFILPEDGGCCAQVFACCWEEKKARSQFVFDRIFDE